MVKFMSKSNILYNFKPLFRANLLLNVNFTPHFFASSYLY